MERIHVTVRTRPLSPKDDKTSRWRIPGNSISNPNHSSKFEFGFDVLAFFFFPSCFLDRIFAESCKTQEVYEARTKNIVAAAVCGFNERAAKNGAEGVRLKEGSHINKSLMTLGTVIKKLSEGAESQGKLTRILQPALGGNANAAIVCNITLAQIHADETKSSLQFASRALRVTNCARVNEGSHSEHFEEEILYLQNTLLQVHAIQFVGCLLYKYCVS
ncbi:hypothetical protein RHMOL_Rhmol02G0149500 [Rhododendron molle]|uniref:Uncharacterized protein n=1 Tax=Rhododendron molle TaxID=49168 RepID=A0ACC0PQN6_RHOML|nr:hypothetical protein RHMOL_Rhmol02G0149500 [Rhododendron molle]